MSEYTEEELRELEELEELEKSQESDLEVSEKEDTVSSKEEVKETEEVEIVNEEEPKKDEEIEEVEIVNEEEPKKDEETEEEIIVKTDEIIEDNTDKEIEISEIEEEKNKTVSDTSYDKLKKRAVSYMIIYGILPRNFKYTVWDSELTQKYIQLQHTIGCKVYKESPEAHHDIFNYDKMIISKK